MSGALDFHAWLGRSERLPVVGLARVRVAEVTWDLALSQGLGRTLPSVRDEPLAEK